MTANRSNCLISPVCLVSIAEGDSIINATLLYCMPSSLFRRRCGCFMVHFQSYYHSLFNCNLISCTLQAYPMALDTGTKSEQMKIYGTCSSCSSLYTPSSWFWLVAHMVASWCTSRVITTHNGLLDYNSMNLLLLNFVSIYTA